MSTAGQFSTKSPTIKRILQESKEITLHPSPDFAAHPIETNLFEWHFTLRGPPSSPYTGGLYHGRIVLPPSYPLRPPSFRFLTPSGRFEVNREICLSISGFHEETWQPAWGIRTALLAIRGFMDSESGGAVGGMDADEGVKRRLAAESRGWRCRECGRTNEEIIEEVEREVAQGEEREEEKVPEELRLGYRDQLGQEGGGKQEEKKNEGTRADGEEQVMAEQVAVEQAPGSSPQREVLGGTRTPRALPAQMAVRQPRPTPTQQVPVQPTRVQVQTRPPNADVAWLDKAIVGVAGALAFMIFRFLFL
ncbi:Ubiquitin-conjugating enzyme-like protein 10 [Elsinoe fawcettii]|nr:Ubiquitin-conjugating enzyme-like protein 10 [Elsinoe fawcettii]